LFLRGSLRYARECSEHIGELPISAGIEKSVAGLWKFPIDVLGINKNLTRIIDFQLDKLIVDHYLLTNTTNKCDMEIFIPIEVYVNSTEIVEATFFEFHILRQGTHKATHSFVIVTEQAFHAVGIQVYTIDISQPQNLVSVAEFAIFYFDHTF